MKKISILFAVCISTVVNAQSFSLYRTNASFVPTATITNGNYIYEATAPTTLIETKMRIKNNAAVTQTFNVTRTIVAQTPTLDMSLVPTAQTTYFCFGNNCFTPPVSTPGPSDYTILLASGQTSTTFPLADNTFDNNQPFSIDLEEGASTGSYIVRYKVFNVANANDTIAFFVGYNQSAGLNHNEGIAGISLDLFPNPTNDEATIFVSSTNNLDVKLNITNATGQLIYNKQHKLNVGENTINLDCKNFAAGIYFVMLGSDKNTQTKKLVISK
ncbi:MAG: T9SS type A sorting domain-containing protein [Bacteroidota bacterium]|nr:T9SS type A sorting domain-containing protein [Bacteroidota bacterium]